MRAWPTAAIVAVVLAAGSLAACAAPSTSPGSSPGATTPTGDDPATVTAGDGTPTPSAPTTAGSTELAGDLQFVRSGGIAGIREQLVVRPDGTLEATGDDGSTVTDRLAADELGRLAALVADVDLAALGRAAERPDVADDLVYTIAHDGVRVGLSSTAVPEEASELTAALGTLLDEQLD